MSVNTNTQVESTASTGGAEPEGETGRKLITEVKKREPDLWPTPTSRDWKNGKASKATHERNARPLNEVATLYPTPRANKWGAPDSHGKVPEDMPPGFLNPQWVEWLMGYPLGWTELED